MLFQELVDSVLRRHRQPIVEEEGRLILARLHDLLHQAKQGNTSSCSESGEHEEFRGESS